MTSSRKLTATLPNGETATRTTARTYTHVVVLEWPSGKCGVLSWCGSLDLARKASRTGTVDYWAAKDGTTVKIVPVNPEN